MLKPEEFLRIVDVTPLVSIDLIVRNEHREILLGKRLNRPAQGSWFVPGGRIWKNERVEEALRRISRRELGVEIADARLLGAFNHIYDDNFLGTPGINTHYVVLGYEAFLSSTVRLTPDDQHGEMKWWNIESLLGDPEVHENTKAYFKSQGGA